MRDLHDCVKEFHRTFGQPILSHPQVPAEDRVRLRMKMIVEEMFELLEATIENADFRKERDFIEAEIRTAPLKCDLVEQVDAFVDIQYFCEGGMLEWGVDSRPVVEEVHRSNMDKQVPCNLCNGAGGWKGMDGPTFCSRCFGKGRRVLKREDGKVIKSEGWTPPDIAGVLAKQMPNK